MNYNPISSKYAMYGENEITDWVLGYANVIKMISPLDRKIILDYGCGTGKFSRHINEQCKQIIAVDNSSKMIEEAGKKEIQNIRYHHIEIQEI